MQNYKLIFFIFKNFGKIFKCKYKFKMPKKCKVLLFDRERSTFINDTKIKIKLEILDVRFESINLPILLKTLVTTGLNNLGKNYIKNFIIYTKPKIIFTFTDYNPTFYILKNLVAPCKVKTVAIQSSFRTGINLWSFEKDKYLKYTCDFFLYFDHFTKENFYKKMIKAKYIKIGSFRSNSFKIKKKTNNKNILFVSQFKNRFFEGYTKTFLREKKILMWLLKLCENKNYNLKIAVKKNITTENRSLKACKKEYLKYFNFLNESYLVGEDGFINNYNEDGKITNFNHVDNAFLIVFAGSTLGIEALSRGKKILSFPLEPYAVDKKDFFWDSKFNYKKFTKAFEKIINMKENTWKKIANKSQLKLKRDENNLTFLKIIQKYRK